MYIPFLTNPIKKLLSLKEKKNALAMARIRNYFFAGLLVAVPIGVTFFVLKFFIGLADKALGLIPQNFQESYPFFKIPGLGILITLALVITVGFLAHNFIGKRIVRLGENIIEKIPLVRSVYSASKQLLETIFTNTNNQFERVVMVEYPRKGILSIGFATGRADGYSEKIFPEPHMSIFVPTTPNPTSGWYVLVPEKDVIPINLSVEEAFKIIISAGIVAPSKMVEISGTNIQDQ